jgi:hypothetical protein
MFRSRETLVTQVDAATLSAICTLAEQEGQPIQAFVEEALADLIQKHTKGKQRAHVTSAYLASHERYERLYKKLAE